VTRLKLAVFLFFVFVLKKVSSPRRQWLMPITLDILGVEIGRIVVSGKKLERPHLHQTGHGDTHLSIPAMGVQGRKINKRIKVQISLGKK
jgi:hypothetical protein